MTATIGAGDTLAAHGANHCADEPLVNDTTATVVLTSTAGSITGTTGSVSAANVTLASAAGINVANVTATTNLTMSAVGAAITLTEGSGNLEPGDRAHCRDADGCDAEESIDFGDDGGVLVGRGEPYAGGDGGYADNDEGYFGAEYCFEDGRPSGYRRRVESADGECDGYDGDGRDADQRRGGGGDHECVSDAAAEFDGGEFHDRRPGGEFDDCGGNDEPGRNDVQSCAADDGAGEFFTGGGTLTLGNDKTLTFNGAGGIVDGGSNPAIQIGGTSGTVNFVNMSGDIGARAARRC